MPPPGDAASAPRKSRILVLSGRGRYEDPWHDMAATSHTIATVLSEGRPHDDVVVRGAFPDAADDLADMDLLVVNTGSGRPDPRHDGDDSRWVAFHESVRSWAEAGKPVLAVHQAANSFADSPHWEQILGGRWVDGTSMHPEIGDATVEVVDGDLTHPIAAGLGRRRVVAFDERYSWLRVADGVQVIATQQHDGVDHPVVWVNATGGRRVVYDALGHDTRSYQSRSRRDLLLAEVRWLLG